MVNLFQDKSVRFALDGSPQYWFTFRHLDRCLSADEFHQFHWVIMTHLGMAGMVLPGSGPVCQRGPATVMQPLPTCLNRADIREIYTLMVTDASNAIRTATAVNGVIPAYQVADFSVAWRHKWLTLESSCNNLLNARYFTRRAKSYPGPGITPVDGRTLYLTLGIKL